jgi:hypothetical protein
VSPQEEAKRIDHECRKAMRARLIERVNIIQHRLDEENEKLHKKQVRWRAVRVGGRRVGGRRVGGRRVGGAV